MKKPVKPKVGQYRDPGLGIRSKQTQTVGSLRNVGGKTASVPRMKAGAMMNPSRWSSKGR